MTGEAMTAQLAALQAELAGVKADSAVKVAALEGTIANLAHENALLRRRLYGNKTERSVTSELQLALGDLLAGEAQLQKDLAAAVGAANAAAEATPDPAKPPGGEPRKPRGRRNLLASKLPRYPVEILDPLDRRATAEHGRGARGRSFVGLVYAVRHGAS